MLDLAAALEGVYSEVGYMEFYRDIFPEGSFETKGIFEAGKYNGIGIAISITPGAKRSRRFTVTDDLEIIEDMAVSDDFCVMSPISYVGKSRKSSNARFMYALAIDLDGVETLKQWQFFLQQVEEGHKMLKFVWGLPKPTYLVSSGTGIHIYYVFEQPVPLFQNVVEKLEVLKKRLTWQAWTQGASSLHEKVQYESLFQGFRMVGTITKNGERCRAFEVGEKVTIEYLNRFVPEEYRAEQLEYKSALTLQQAKQLYPEWYQKRIVERQPRGTWVCKEELYQWWIRRILGGAEQGHRYWCIMTLATYAKKCGISREQLEEDAYGLIPFLNTRGDEFTEDDVLHALEAFTDSYITYPIDTIVNRTGIKIEKNKRNGRKQSIHVKIMSSTRDILYPEGKWREGNGRPSAEQTVRDFLNNNPFATKKEIKDSTGLSYPTIRKYYDKIIKEINTFKTMDEVLWDSIEESGQKWLEYQKNGK